MSAYQDDGERDRYAVAISVRDLGDGRVGLVFDDLERDRALQCWKHFRFVTVVTLTNEQLDDMELSDDQLRDLGRMLVVGLNTQKTIKRLRVSEEE